MYLMHKMESEKHKMHAQGHNDNGFINFNHQTLIMMNVIKLFGLSCTQVYLHWTVWT